MALLPPNQVELLDEYLEADLNQEDEPSKTFRIDFENFRIGNLSDNEEALRQAIVKAILTPRAFYYIYNDNYGCEIWDLVGTNVTNEYLDSEIPRMVTEAIVYDDRINAVTNVTVCREGDTAYISLTVDSIFGEVEAEVII